ncbi:hypothetical protein STCU_11182 [Strigomonas culicis]|uniref:Uncharacterized protein n=1 Tax=Strigomonas culicis TaxID=28005 RepID=S9TI02_9TRYP|nr:hypothetical protein STCU_11182 [Strigomonas culicis]|eukprot:EPY16514.1 hypothetical protein STCU_11182 [Strigomonas culicis]
MDMFDLELEMDLARQKDTAPAVASPPAGGSSAVANPPSGHTTVGSATRRVGFHNLNGNNSTTATPTNNNNSNGTPLFSPTYMNTVVGPHSGNLAGASHTTTSHSNSTSTSHVMASYITEHKDEAARLAAPRARRCGGRCSGRARRCRARTCRSRPRTRARRR